MKSGDGAEKYHKDIKKGKLNDYLLKCLLFTVLEPQNHMREFIGSDGRHYKNQLCLDNTNGETLASKNLHSMKKNEVEKTLLSLWDKIISQAKKTEKYNPVFNYGLYQIKAELNTTHVDPDTKDSVPDYPELNKIRFEVQMRTVLQHAWANMNHDTGYKSGVEIPKVYLRNLSRLAGMLELVDDEFSRIRRELADYRRQVQNLVASGNLSEVPLDGDSFRSYLNIRPFDRLTRRIASINQAEIQDADLSAFLPLFKAMRFATIGDIDNMVKEYSEAAYQIACFQMGLTDLDILSASVAPQNLCMAYILKNGGGRVGIKLMLDELNGKSDSNDAMAGFLVEQCNELPFMNQ